MAGRPKYRAMVAELERRTRETFEDDESKTHLDYVAHWVESGKTLKALAKLVAKKAGAEADTMPAMVRRYLDKTFGEGVATARLAAARKRAGVSLAEESIEIADEDVGSSEAAARARNQISSRQWLAERWAREDLGQPKGPVVQISVGSMHLDALRTRSIEAPRVRDGDASARVSSECVEVTQGEESAIDSAILLPSESVTVEVTEG